MIVPYLIISFLASVVGAISGIGGGIIIKPVLDAFGGFSVSTISFLSGTTVLSMTVVSLIKSLRLGVSIEKRTSTILAAGSIVGGIAGKYLFGLAKSSLKNDSFVGIIQSAFLIVMTVGVLIYVIRENRISKLKITSSPFVGCIGLVLGCISAFLGIGGGPLNLAVLSYFFSMDSKTAAINSIYTILFSQASSLIFTVAGGSIPTFPPLVLIVMILGGITGGFYGSVLRVKMTNKKVSQLFCGIMVLIIMITCYNLFKYSAIVLR